MTSTTSKQMTGRRETRNGREVLVLERTFRAGIEDVWAACTEPERMERWIGTWSGDPAAGEIRFRMTAEGEDVPEEVYEVERCDPPTGFAVRSREGAPFSADGSGPKVQWILTVDLVEVDGVTTLTFTQDVHHDLLGNEMVASVGPGWEYYVERLVAHLGAADVSEVRWESFEPGATYYRDLFT